jgi:hypothetical protein
LILLFVLIVILIVPTAPIRHAPAWPAALPRGDRSGRHYDAGV